MPGDSLNYTRRTEQVPTNPLEQQLEALESIPDGWQLIVPDSTGQAGE